jgi:hypothetical protein
LLLPCDTWICHKDTLRCHFSLLGCTCALRCLLLIHARRHRLRFILVKVVSRIVAQLANSIFNAC